MTDKTVDLSLGIQNYFIANKLTISCAESCSGGLLAAALTYHGGASHFFKMGLITYDNQAKSKLLHIDDELLNKKGAVSEEVANLMARRCCELSQTSAALSITGIAGPGSDEKSAPVGLVYIGFSCANKTEVRKFHFKGAREKIRQEAVLSALALLIEKMAEI